jgi:glycine/D-amino acid oxidase-like deaminating enzyme
VGSGAGGLATAVTAARLGLKVVVAEKACFGGTTAWSGGWLWVPRNPLAIAAGIDEDPALPRQYLQSELGQDFDAALADAYLSRAAHGGLFPAPQPAALYRRQPDSGLPRPQRRGGHRWALGVCSTV